MLKQCNTTATRLLFYYHFFTFSCSAWNRNGFCSSTFYSHTDKKNHCAKTCNLCSSGSSGGSGRSHGGSSSSGGYSQSINSSVLNDNDGKLLLLMMGDTQYFFPCSTTNRPCKAHSAAYRAANGLNEVRKLLLPKTSKNHFSEFKKNFIFSIVPSVIVVEETVKPETLKLNVIRSRVNMQIRVRTLPSKTFTTLWELSQLPWFSMEILLTMVNFINFNSLKDTGWLCPLESISDWVIMTMKIMWISVRITSVWTIWCYGKWYSNHTF